MITFPKTDEYNPYYKQYIQYLAEEDVMTAFIEGLEDVNELMASLTEEQLRSAYAEGKWTIKEVLQHLMDSERIFCSRALRVARNDKTELPGFDQNAYVPYSEATERNSMELLQEYNSVRQATIALFKSFSEEMLLRTGTASNDTISVRALAHIIAGHEKHHLHVINERYL